ncbi:Uu.00g090880.m01.CDS01 [Anthostomella pinea]|uniref:Uu.00g090880.m01.CDS01 n=1 Tax=Anthostomella pinea TaxID=933095 RepID=A0AAI8VNN1_9PEZI|nr:Uu.00g090880.m01.CDS01 [Anthostomella pinea]
MSTVTPSSRTHVKELLEVLGMKTLNHKATFRSALGQFCRLSPKYNRLELQYADTPAHNDSLFAAAATDKPPRKRRRVAPTNINAPFPNGITQEIGQQPPQGTAPQLTRAVLGTERRRLQPQLRQSRGYFGNAGLSSYNILHRDLDSPEYQFRKFSFQSNNVPVGHQIQVNHLLKRAAYRRCRGSPLPRGRKQQAADSITPLNDPFDDEVLPLYGESDEEYDSETWKEIQEEQGERRSRQPHSNSLTAQAIEIILNEIF